jgi:hypothetical protein
MYPQKIGTPLKPSLYSLYLVGEIQGCAVPGDGFAAMNFDPEECLRRLYGPMEKGVNCDMTARVELMTDLLVPENRNPSSPGVDWTRMGDSNVTLAGHLGSIVPESIRFNRVRWPVSNAFRLVFWDHLHLYNPDARSSFKSAVVHVETNNTACFRKQGAIKPFYMVEGMWLMIRPTQRHYTDLANVNYTLADGAGEMVKHVLTLPEALWG